MERRGGWSGGPGRIYLEFGLGVGVVGEWGRGHFLWRRGGGCGRCEFADQVAHCQLLAIKYSWLCGIRYLRGIGI